MESKLLVTSEKKNGERGLIGVSNYILDST